MKTCWSESFWSPFLMWKSSLQCCCRFLVYNCFSLLFISFWLKCTFHLEVSSKLAHLLSKLAIYTPQLLQLYQYVPYTRSVISSLIPCLKMTLFFCVCLCVQNNIFLYGLMTISDGFWQKGYISIVVIFDGLNYKFS